MLDPAKYFFFCLSWTSAFSYGYFNIPLIMGFLVTIKALSNAQMKFWTKRELALLCSAVLVIGWTILTSLVNGRVGNFSMAYIVCYLVLVYGPALYISQGKSASKYWHWFRMGLGFIACVIVAESVVRWLTGYDITGIVPQAKENYALAGVEHGLIRARGFSTEPVIAGIYMAIGLVAEISDLGWRKGKIGKILLFSSSIVCTGSASAIVSAGCGIIALCLSRIRLRFPRPRMTFRGISLLVTGLAISVGTGALAWKYMQPYVEVFGTIYEKLSGQETSKSLVVRMGGISEFLEYWRDDSLGLNGYVGKFSHGGSAINYYITLLGDTGVIGAIIYLTPVIIAWIVLAISYRVDSHRNEKLSLLVTSSVSLAFHGTFYASPIWAVIVFVMFL